MYTKSHTSAAVYDLIALSDYHSYTVHGQIVFSSAFIYVWTRTTSSTWVSTAAPQV